MWWLRLKGKHVCPVERAGTLDSRIRRLVQNPYKILKPYIKKNMTVLDIGCGPGFFSIDMAKIVGSSGRVIAADLQYGMLEKIKNKIKGTKFQERIILHKCEKDKIGVTKKVDFVLLFYMVHEVPDIELLFKEIGTILKPKGQVFIAEPLFHVSKQVFENNIKKACNKGLKIVQRPRIFFSKTAVLEKT
ncbi:MAG: SAM-dependent methyltransferase [Desulfobacteraceae bacterium 4572_130]|nr:MAG: SAM-dependent methyltransferase [Desulfobacteraceae bacterium 4572_130]